MIGYVLPTRDRPEVLAHTLRALGDLTPHDAEVVIVDNASREPVGPPRQLRNGLGVRVVRRASNEGAAGRNAGVAALPAAREWIVMLDDDSAPDGLGHLHAIADAPRGVAAVAAEIVLERPDGSVGPRESGGLPEVFIGCGVAIRRDAFVEAGGYDHAFQYYAEEYDLAARLLARGHAVGFDRRFRVRHRKVGTHRDMHTILGRLVRNNGWVMQRYAPGDELASRLRETIDRYGAIAEREHARAGYEAGLRELRATLHKQVRTPLPRPAFDRFTGLAHARQALREAAAERPLGRVRIVAEGKNAWAVRRALSELRAEVLDPDAPGDADTLVIGTLSPGPMLDALDAHRGETPIVAPWLAARTPVPAGT